ncbi:hypothetical protein SAMN05446935_5935 [Burkholderia sp. YR290]|nr:hypothetical protein SAMN05446935_5935 [Burkholderia sp. YR290]
MQFDIGEFVDSINANTKDILKASIADKLPDLLNNDPAIVEESHEEHALAGVKGKWYDISVIRLASGLAGLTVPFLGDPNSAIIIGVGVLATVSALFDIVEPIEQDPAALCQALCEVQGDQKLLTKAQLVAQLAILTKNENELDSRYRSAIDTLKRLDIVDVDADTIKLNTMILFNRPA